MSYTIVYSNEHIKNNNNSTLLEGISEGDQISIPLEDPEMDPGYKFLGWYLASESGKSVKNYKTSISNLDFSESNTQIYLYADYVEQTTVGIYGRTISEVADSKYMLTIDNLDSSDSRELSAIKVDDLASKLTSHVQVIDVPEFESSVTVSPVGVRSEYYLNLHPSVMYLNINVGSSSSGVALFHISKNEYEYDQGIVEVKITRVEYGSSKESNPYELSIGSTLMFDLDSLEVFTHYAPEAYLKVDEVVNSILNYRNFVITRDLDMLQPENGILTPVTIGITTGELAHHSFGTYKSVNLYFDNTKYNQGSDATLEGKHGYFNLVDPKITKVSSVGDSTTGYSWDFEITYDSIPAYSDRKDANGNDLPGSLGKYTKSIPVRLVMVI